jgi:hypothetical protein
MVCVNYIVKLCSVQKDLTLRCTVVTIWNTSLKFRNFPFFPMYYVYVFRMNFKINSD